MFTLVYLFGFLVTLYHLRHEFLRQDEDTDKDYIVRAAANVTLCVIWPVTLISFRW